MGQEIGLPARGPPEKKKKAKKPPKVPAAGGTRAPGGGLKGSSTKTPGLSEAAKAKLRQRLQQVRERALGTGATTTQVIISDGDDEEIQRTSTEDEEYSSAPERGKRNKPDNPFPPIPPLALDDLKVKEESKTKRKKTDLREKKKKEKRKARDDSARDVAPLVATSGGTSKSWRRQLVEKAVLASEMKAKDKKKKGNKKTSHSKKIQEALSYWVEKEEGQEQRWEEKEEESCDERWSDRELQRELKRRVFGSEFELFGRDGLRYPYEEEKQGYTRISTCDAREPRQGAVGSGGNDRTSIGGFDADLRNSSDDVFHAASEAEFSNESEGATRATSSSGLRRCAAKRRHSSHRRRPSGEIYLDPSVATG